MGKIITEISEAVGALFMFAVAIAMVGAIFLGIL
jgi:hypothetical protein